MKEWKGDNDHNLNKAIMMIGMETQLKKVNQPSLFFPLYGLSYTNKPKATYFKALKFAKFLKESTNGQFRSDTTRLH